MSTWSSTFGKGHLSDIRIANISKSFTHTMAAKTSCHKIWNKITSVSPCVYKVDYLGLRLGLLS